MCIIVTTLFIYLTVDKEIYSSSHFLFNEVYGLDFVFLIWDIVQGNNNIDCLILFRGVVSSKESVNKGFSRKSKLFKRLFDKNCIVNFKSEQDKMMLKITFLSKNSMMQKKDRPVTNIAK